MLTQLRNSAQSWVIKLLLGLIAVTFVISFGVGTFTNPKEVLVEVSGTEIMVVDYMREYQRELDQLRQRFSENAETLAAQINLRQQVLERMINRQVLLDAAGERNLRVTDAELQAAVTEQPAFRVEQRFDFETYRQILAQNNMSPADFEQRTREDLLLGKQQRNLIAGVIVSQAEVDQRYRIENEQVQVDYVYVDPARLRVTESPPEEALKAYHEAHPEQFTQPTQFKLRYFVLGLAALEEDAEIRDRAVERYYERNLEAEFSTPKRVRASHILKRLPQDADEAKTAETRQAAEAVLAQVRAGGDFVALAKAHSEDPSAAKGGDLGWFTREDMVTAFADAAFALPEGAVSNVVRSPFGFHIIRVTGVEEGTSKSLDEVRARIVAKLRAERAERKLDLEVERLPGRVRRDGIETTARSFGATVQGTEFFDESGVLAGLGTAGPLYAQVANRRKGDVGVWRRNPVLGHVFYEVADRSEAFVQPLDAVKARVVQATLDQRRREQAMELAKEAFQRLQDGGQTLEQFARARGYSVDSTAFTVVDRTIEGVGANRELQRAAFGLSPQQIYAVSISDQKAYLLRYTGRRFLEPAQAAAKKAQIAARLEEQLRQYVLSTEVDRLRAASKVEVMAPEYLSSTGSAMPTAHRMP